MSGGKSITKFDVLFFYECGIAVIVNECLLHWQAATVAVLVLIGLTFELVTCASWTYSEAFKRSYFVVDGTDVSVAAALSWAGVLMLFSAMSDLLQQAVNCTGGRFIVPILMAGICGNILETICFRWGMFVYNDTPVTRMFFLRKPIFIWGVPIAVRLGYFLIFGPICCAALALGR
jgi:hypothetical protein